MDPDRWRALHHAVLTVGLGSRARVEHDHPHGHAVPLFGGHDHDAEEGHEHVHLREPRDDIDHHPLKSGAVPADNHG